MSQQQQEWRSLGAEHSSESSAADWSVCSAPLSVSEEELRSELSLLGFSSVPRPRLLQFKEDLEQLMRSRFPSDSSASGHHEKNIPESDWEQLMRSRFPSDSSASGHHEKENIPESDWEQLMRSRFPSDSSASGHTEKENIPESDWEQRRDEGDSCSERSFKLANHGRRITRKVLRRRSDGRAQVCDESSLSLDTESRHEEEEKGESRLSSRASCATSGDCAKSFIRLPPYSLLEQYRQHSDRVGRYQEYKRSWEALQGALERGKKDLRWRVRERMMSAPPAPLPRPLPAPNAYIIPTEKKRYGLRWAIRQDLVNGNIPRAGP